MERATAPPPPSPRPPCSQKEKIQFGKRVCIILHFSCRILGNVSWKLLSQYSSFAFLNSGKQVILFVPKKSLSYCSLTPSSSCARRYFADLRLTQGLIRLCNLYNINKLSLMYTSSSFLSSFFVSIVFCSLASQIFLHPLVDDSIRSFYSCWPLHSFSG